ncbi:hypothetical protein B0T24DRAFT_539064 [Lasiosphaeria ovina]|uniref:DUF1772-domain-containing protein n=1 Tax=Lasiosphaeria ovina TaxID=92902 RepID=A0AAE0JTZ8_9PEZI|nr:hypothetical protein B0T24DRAFT_539064 [Lasiosphaeria ovina]
MPTSPTEAVVGTTIAFSFILLGNAITQSFMGVPALLVDFPQPSSPEHAAAARHLGRQWSVFWNVGNVFFRPISTLGIFGYAYASWAARGASPGSSHGTGTSFSGLVSGSTAPLGLAGDWRLYALSAACHLVTVLHSALNMQPLNNKLDGLRSPKTSGVDESLAEYYARRWIKLNSVRVVMPFVAGSVALWQTLRSRTSL